jgi:hypothetical protein
MGFMNEIGRVGGSKKGDQMRMYSNLFFDSACPIGGELVFVRRLS